MVEAEDCYLLQSKREAITALLPHAIWQERDRRPEMLNTILHAARASKTVRFMSLLADRPISIPLSEASPRAIVLASPHIPWSWFADGENLVQQWAATASVVPYTEEVAQCVVDTLLHIASNNELAPHIPSNLWSWLGKRPSLPPICSGRDIGARGRVVKGVRELKDIEVLKSYLLLIWSEWDTLYAGGFDEIYTSIWQDFGGIGMGHHRADLIQRLDHVLGQLDRGLEYFKQHSPEFHERKLQTRKDQYRGLREALLEANENAIRRASRLKIAFCSILTLPRTDIGSRATFMCALPLPCP